MGCEFAGKFNLKTEIGESFVDIISCLVQSLITLITDSTVTPRVSAISRQVSGTFHLIAYSHMYEASRYGPAVGPKPVFGTIGNLHFLLDDLFGRLSCNWRRYMRRGREFCDFPCLSNSGQSEHCGNDKARFKNATLFMSIDFIEFNFAK